MADTKENILLTALRLFSKDGYQAVSVREIAEQLGMTKGALYKHYRNKRDIFDSIIERMNQTDIQRARQYQVPDNSFSQAQQSYQETSIESIKVYSEAQFKYWTEDEFASCFRKMLTLEQYRSSEMSVLYQQYLSGGPIGYLEDLFREMPGHYLWQNKHPKQLALELYAPIYLLMNLYDGAEDKEIILALVQEHIRGFAVGLE